MTCSGPFSDAFDCPLYNPRKGYAMTYNHMIEACAHAAHEANRVYCLALGDTSQPSWEQAPEWQKSSARNGVLGALAGSTPEQSHESWLAEKASAGWKYGPVKDPEKKEHPCFRPYHELPDDQKKKDALFVGTVRLVGAVLGATIVYPATATETERTVDWSKSPLLW